jgi:hypothetical protein
MKAWAKTSLILSDMAWLGFVLYRVLSFVFYQPNASLAAAEICDARMIQVMAIVFASFFLVLGLILTGVLFVKLSSLTKKTSLVTYAVLALAILGPVSFVSLLVLPESLFAANLGKTGRLAKEDKERYPLPYFPKKALPDRMDSVASYSYSH